MVVVSRRRRVNSLRLSGYDYAQPGLYFVTFCAQHRDCLLGHIDEGRLALNPLGRLVEKTWRELPRHYEHIRLDEMVIMPNHVHAIIELTDAEVPKRNTLSEIVRAWKGYSAKAINRVRRTPEMVVWQRGFWDEIITSEQQAQTIRTYIRENPLRWEMDRLHPDTPTNDMR